MEGFGGKSIYIYIYMQQISHLLHVVNQDAGTFSLKMHKTPFKAAAAAEAAASWQDEIR